MAAWLAEWLPADRCGRALELGAGPGIFTENALPWCGEYLATDISPAMCAAGRAAIPRVAWDVMDAASPQGGPWDWIFTSSMLQWATCPSQMLTAWRERLATHGRVLAGLYVAGSLSEVDALLGERAPVQWRTASTWREALAAANLRLIRDTADRRVFHYRSALNVWRSLHGVGAVSPPRLGPGELRRLLHDFDRRHRTPAGVPITWAFYRFEAQRAR